MEQNCSQLDFTQNAFGFIPLLHLAQKTHVMLVFLSRVGVDCGVVGVGRVGVLERTRQSSSLVEDLDGSSPSWSEEEPGPKNVLQVIPQKSKKKKRRKIILKSTQTVFMVSFYLHLFSLPPAVWAACLVSPESCSGWRWKVTAGLASHCRPDAP